MSKAERGAADGGATSRGLGHKRMCTLRWPSDRDDIHSTIYLLASLPPVGG